MKVYNVPLELVVNMDQTVIALVPMSKDWKFSQHGSKEASMIGQDYKRSITIVPSMSVAGYVLPL